MLSLLYGSHLTLVESRDIGIRLEPDIAWDTGAAKVHGLTEMEARHGTPALEALTALQEAMRSVDVVIAHNLAFDKPVIRAAGYAVGLRDLWPAPSALGMHGPPRVKEFCTMKATTTLVKLPATAAQAKYADLGPYKAPKLNELYAWLYGHVYDISGATLHSSKSDVHCLNQCIARMLRKGYLTVAGGTLLLASPTDK